MHSIRCASRRFNILKLLSIFRFYGIYFIDSRALSVDLQGLYYIIIFLIFDPAHNIKSLYNNFKCRKLFGCPACEPFLAKPTKASFQDVEKVFELESSKRFKMGHKLNTSVTSPKSIEKTSMKSALAVFNESVCR